MSANNGRNDQFDSTTPSNPTPGPELFFGFDSGARTDAPGTDTPAAPMSVPDVQQEVHDPSRDVTVFNGQLDGLDRFGVSRQDTVDSGMPGGHPTPQGHGPSVAYTQPSSNLDGLGWHTNHRPSNGPEPTSWGDPSNDMGFHPGLTSAHSFGEVTKPDTSGNGVDYDDSGAGHGSTSHGAL